LEASALHKGLVLVLDGKELVEEGLGFGVPVVKYEDKTFFSTSTKHAANCGAADSTLTKSFVIDAISRKRVGKTSYLNDDFYRFCRKLFEQAYLRNKSYASLFNRIMELRETMGIHTDFVKVKQRGMITMNYSIQPKSIKIKADLSRLELDGCQEILILNEQGSTFFNKYSDANGTTLFNEEIGAWKSVNARSASLSDAEGTLKFTLTKNSGRLFRGLERTKGRFSWAGLSYSLNPQSSIFNYDIKLSLKS
jgi:hypothetical protein